MFAALDNLAIFEHECLVSVADGAQSMGDDEGCTSFEQPVQSALDEFFGAGIDTGGGFIKDQDTGISQKRTGDGDKLTLSL